MAINAAIDTLIRVVQCSVIKPLIAILIAILVTSSSLSDLAVADRGYLLAGPLSGGSNYPTLKGRAGYSAEG